MVRIWISRGLALLNAARDAKPYHTKTEKANAKTWSARLVITVSPKRLIVGYLDKLKSSTQLPVLFFADACQPPEPR